MEAYSKLKNNGEITDFDKLSLLDTVGNSGAPGATAVAAKLMDIFEE